MRKLVLWPLLALLLAACGGSTAAACNGLPTANRTAARTAAALGFSGATRGLDKRFLCAHFGRPWWIKAISGGREIWAYPVGTGWFTLSSGRVVGHSDPQPSY